MSWGFVCLLFPINLLSLSSVREFLNDFFLSCDVAPKGWLGYRKGAEPAQIGPVRVFGVMSSCLWGPNLAVGPRTWSCV